MTTPNYMPSIAAGMHSPRSGKACVMEYVSLLAGERWSDSPECTNVVVAAVARFTNDSLGDGERHLLVPLINRLFGTNVHNKHDTHVLNVRLAIYCAKYVLATVPSEHKSVCQDAIGAAEAWCVDQTKEKAEQARHAAHIAKQPGYGVTHPCNAAAYAAFTAAHMANLAKANDTAAQAGHAATYAVLKATENAERRIAFLTSLIDEYDHLVGRSPVQELSPTQLQSLKSSLVKV